MNKSLRERLPSLTFCSARACPLRARVQRPGGLLACLLLARLVGGCDSGTGNPDAVPNDPRVPPPLEAANIEHGHYRGLATIDGKSHHAEALLTVDGAFRLFLGALAGPESGPVTGAGLDEQLLDPEESMQFSGHVAVNGSEGSGTGRVIGETCAAPNAGRFCGDSAAAEVGMSALANRIETKLTGEIRIATSAGEETWELDLSPWSAYYHLRATPGQLGNPFTEELAQFAEGDQVVISFDGAGRLFFQGPATGCTGNGVLTPHLDGEFYVFDVDLLIENCNASYAFLNTRLTGLATETQNGYWDLDTWLVMFVSTPEGAESPVALTLYAGQMAGWDY